MRFGRQNFLGVCLSVVCQKDALIIVVTLVFFVFFLISWADLLNLSSKFGVDFFRNPRDPGDSPTGTSRPLLAGLLESWG
jgi:hypothetical protein